MNGIRKIKKIGEYEIYYSEITNKYYVKGKFGIYNFKNFPSLKEIKEKEREEWEKIILGLSIILNEVR